ncbi:hypothetical protein GOBAR_DD18331 [Gossypium barbadense]|nr:hypothetical protein GOBAR_DD18331 [Gossypium barbadense]
MEDPGSEAMFADLGHFSYAAIQTAFTFLVYIQLLYWHIWVTLLICLNIIIRVTTSAKTGDVNACSYKNKCRFSPDIEAFMAQKPADLEGDCPFIKADAPCPYGLACRFVGTHKDNTPAATSNLLKKSFEVNGLNKDVQKLLWKNKMRFTKADAVVKSLGLAKLVDEEDEVGLDGSHAADVTNCKKVVDDSVDSVNAEEACETDELRPLKKAKLVVDEKCFDEEEDIIPQRLNWRPSSYYGQDDLETLMAFDSTAIYLILQHFYEFKSFVKLAASDTNSCCYLASIIQGSMLILLQI